MLVPKGSSGVLGRNPILSAEFYPWDPRRAKLSPGSQLPSCIMNAATQNSPHAPRGQDTQHSRRGPRKRGHRRAPGRTCSWEVRICALGPRVSREKNDLLF